MDNPALADAIFHLRGRRRQEDFAREIGVSKRTLIRWEQGHTALMRLEHAARLNKLGIPWELLLGTATDQIVVTVAPRHGGTTIGIVHDEAAQDTPAERGVA